MKPNAQLGYFARNIVAGAVCSGLIACCVYRGGRSETPTDMAPTASNQADIGSPAESAEPIASVIEAPSPTTPSDDEPKVRVDQTPALKRCQEHNLAAISKWGAKVGTFCKQGGCRIMESPAKIYEELLWCGKDLDGAWGVTMTDPTLQTKKDEEDDPQNVKLSGTLAITRFTANKDGKVSMTEAAGWDALDYSIDWFSMVNFRHELSDLDGDGTPELVLRRYYMVEESPDMNTSLVSAFRIRQGAIETIPEILALKAEAIVDADKDGKLDFVLDSPFATTFPCISECTFSGPRLLAHTIQGGRLDQKDDVAKDYVRRQCAKPYEDAGPELGEWFDIACEKFMGAPLPTVVQRLRTSQRAKNFPDSKTREAAIQTWATAPVPFLIERPKKAKK